MAMMHWMRRIAPYLLGAVLVAFLVSLAYFGGRGITQDGGGREAVVTVNGESVSAVAYQRTYRIRRRRWNRTGVECGGWKQCLHLPGAYSVCRYKFGSLVAWWHTYRLGE